MKAALLILEKAQLRLLNGRSYYWMSIRERNAYDKLLSAQVYLLSHQT